MQARKEVQLILDDGSRFSGYSFGYENPVAGEVVFNTAMTGYPESLTDPSYSGQMMVLTYPLVGNYGVPPQTFEANGLSTFLESEKIHAEAIIVSDYSENYSHWNAVESLGDWLKKEKIAGITGIDTRALTKLLREKGSMKGKIVFEDENEIDFVDPNLINQVARVSCREVITYGNGKKRVVLVRLRRETQYHSLPAQTRRYRNTGALGLRLQHHRIRRTLHLKRSRRPRYVRHHRRAYP